MTKLELFHVVGTAALVVPMVLALVVWGIQSKRARGSHRWGYAMAVDVTAHKHALVCPHCKSNNVRKAKVLETSLNDGAQKLAGIRIRCRVCEEVSYLPETSRMTN